MSNASIKPTRFYGQGDPPLDQQLFEEFFPHKRFGFFIECGAADGLGYNNSILFETHAEWTGINLEASLKQYSALVINRPETLNLHMGLASYTGTALFTDVVSAPGGGEGNGSFSHTSEHLEELMGYRCVFKEYMVPVISFKDLIRLFDVRYVDLFALDVEGYELQVIEGMRGSEVMPDVMCVEHSIVGQDNIIQALPDYTLEGENYVNSIFVRKE
jgi:FkbM family methyltransferase